MSEITRLLRISEVEHRTGLSRTTIWRRRRAGLFPNPVAIGNALLGWYEHEIQEWIEARPRVSIAAAGALDQAETAAA